MAATLPRLDVEFKTLGGLTLRGWLYTASKRGPAMILSPGFNMPKEAIIPDICEWFQKRGDITCFAYDPRCIGTSDGEPRNDIDPRQHAEDLHDAVTWLSEHPLVDGTKIMLWGVCYGGNITLAAAAFDKRIAAAVVVAPLIDATGNPERRQAILELAMYDRAGRLAGDDSIYLPYVNEDDGSAPTGLQMTSQMIPALERMGVAVENRVTVQTYYRAMSWSVLNLVGYIAPTPLLMVTPEFDEACPTAQQLDAFDRMGEPKELDILKGKGHFDWIFGDVDGILSTQLDFLKRRMGF